MELNYENAHLFDYCVPFMLKTETRQHDVLEAHDYLSKAYPRLLTLNDMFGVDVLEINSNMMDYKTVQKIVDNPMVKDAKLTFTGEIDGKMHCLYFRANLHYRENLSNNPKDGYVEGDIDWNGAYDRNTKSFYYCRTAPSFRYKFETSSLFHKEQANKTICFAAMTNVIKKEGEERLFEFNGVNTEAFLSKNIMKTVKANFIKGKKDVILRDQLVLPDSRDVFYPNTNIIYEMDKANVSRMMHIDNVLAAKSSEITTQTPKQKKDKDITIE